MAEIEGPKVPAVDRYMDALVTSAKAGGVLWKDNRKARGNASQIVLRFANDLGVSLVNEYDVDAFIASSERDRTPGGVPIMEDEVEIGVIAFDASGGWELTYETDVTGDVLRHLSFDEATEAIAAVMALPPMPGAALRSRKFFDATVSEVQGRIVTPLPDTLEDALEQRREIEKDRGE